MKNPRIILLFAIGTLAACNTSSTPYIDNCKLMVKNIINVPNISWEKALKTENNTGMLQVDLAFAGLRPNQTASCFFPAKNPDNEEMVSAGQYRGSPSVVTINGQQVDDETVVKATLETMREFGKQNYQQATESAQQVSDTVREISDQAGEKARKTALEAVTEVQKKLEKMEEQ